MKIFINNLNYNIKIKKQYLIKLIIPIQTVIGDKPR